MNICAQISININISAQIGLQEFLRLFLNHRPARGEDTAQLEKVFKVQFLFLENTKRAACLSKQLFRYPGYWKGADRRSE